MKKKQWKDKGYKGSRYGAATPFLDSGHEHDVENTETGERRSIQVRSDQTLGEAIDAGNQWTEVNQQINAKNSKDSAENAARVNAESDRLSGKILPAAEGRNFTAKQIVALLQEAARKETTIRDLCRSHGIGESRFYKWRSRYGGMSLEQVKEVRKHKNENGRGKSESAERETKN
ncbi:MAG TPA: transposase [Pyrinomonadaceae bacterium]